MADRVFTGPAYPAGTRKMARKRRRQRHLRRKTTARGGVGRRAQAHARACRRPVTAGAACRRAVPSWGPARTVAAAAAPGVAYALGQAIPCHRIGVTLTPVPPILRMRLCPGALGGPIIGTIIRIAGPLGPLPVTLARPLACRLRTVGLGRILGARSKRLAAAATAGRVAHLSHQSAECLAVEVGPDTPSQVASVGTFSLAQTLTPKEAGLNS